MFYTLSNLLLLCKCLAAESGFGAASSHSFQNHLEVKNHAVITVCVFVVNFAQPITFADFFVADVLTSMAKVGDLIF